MRMVELLDRLDELGFLNHRHQRQDAFSAGHRVLLVAVTGSDA
jgi:hypothetical protein